MFPQLKLTVESLLFIEPFRTIAITGKTFCFNENDKIET